LFGIFDAAVAVSAFVFAGCFLDLLSSTLDSLAALSSSVHVLAEILKSSEIILPDLRGADVFCPSADSSFDTLSTKTTKALLFFCL
jgi:hypothetical protein